MLKHYSKLILISILSCISGHLYGQIDLYFPSERAVFQRNNNNTGRIYTAGLTLQDVDKIEGRLLPLQNGWGTATNWVTIDQSVEGQSFNGFIEGTAGWYRLELRSVVNNQPVHFFSISRVGIGEVFLIAGQSNAQGEGNNINALPASDDRVNAYKPNYYNHNTALYDGFPEILPRDAFTKIEANTNIGPSGYTAWCYGELGDKLVQKLNVPVLFFNTGLSATSSENWISSSNGQDTYNIISGIKFQKDFPYKALKNILNQLIPTYGLRAVLWHQGESDLRNSEQGYINNLVGLISKSRSDFGEKMPWVISRASSFFNVNASQTISAQNKVISSVENTWAGPETDNIQIPRPDGAHFENNNNIKGLSLLASAWNNSLNNNFFNAFAPVAPKGLTEIKYNCVNANSAEFRIDASFQNINWSTGSTSSKIQSSNDDITATYRDGFGNLLYTNRIIANNVTLKNSPQLSSTEGLKGCVGKPLTLQAAPSKYNILWNTGNTSNTLIVNNSGNYSAKFKNAQNCESSSSTLNIEFLQPPAKPTVSINNGTGYECQGKTINISVINPANYTALWSNGEKGTFLSINQNQSKPLTVSLSNIPGCVSAQSDSVKYRILPIPTTPRLEQSGPYSLKAFNPEKDINSYDWFFDNKFVFNSTNDQIPVFLNGFFSVKAVKSITYEPGKIFECKSNLSGLVSLNLQSDTQKGLRAYPNPSVNKKITLASANEIKNVAITFYTTSGQRLTSLTLPSLNLPVEIDLTAIKPKGTVIIKIESGPYFRSFPVIFE